MNTLSDQSGCITTVAQAICLTGGLCEGRKTVHRELDIPRHSVHSHVAGDWKPPIERAQVGSRCPYTF